MCPRKYNSLSPHFTGLNFQLFLSLSIGKALIKGFLVLEGKNLIFALFFKFVWSIQES